MAFFPECNIKSKCHILAHQWNVNFYGLNQQDPLFAGGIKMERITRSQVAVAAVETKHGKVNRGF